MSTTSSTDGGVAAGGTRKRATSPGEVSPDPDAGDRPRPGGYAGRLLYVDLGSGDWHTETLDPEMARLYLGGSGLGARLYLDTVLTQVRSAADRVRLHASGGPEGRGRHATGGTVLEAAEEAASIRAIEPLSPDNPFVIMTGPVTGMPLNAVSRWTVGTRSPLTGLWGDANVGGYFGAELKAAGFDGMVITGAAERPVYLTIEDGSAAVCDATAYWGLDTYATEAALVAAHAAAGVASPTARPSRSGHVLAIGPAGENQVRFACLVHHKGHVAGRAGLGAVWGAKNLKAIYVRGSTRTPPHDRAGLAELRAELADVYADSITIEGLRAFGTVSHMDVGVILGDIPMKNWQEAEWEDFDELGPLTYAERLHAGNRTCYGCGVRCKREAEVTDGPHRFERGPGPEYETVAAFGTMLLNSDIEAIGKANDLCNRLGLDTISCGATIAWAAECAERGLLAPADDMPPLAWGAPDAALELVERIADRRGLGDLLAEGSARAAAAIGAGADALTTVKGLEAPLHDPRSAHGMGLAYAVSPRGACHMAGVAHWVEAGGMYVPEIPELADEPEGMSSEGKALLNAAAQDFGTFFAACAVFCNLGAIVLNATQAVSAVRHSTGFDYDLEEALLVGKRVWYLKRGLSNLFGARAEDDRLPSRLLQPLDHGPTRGSIPDMELMLGQFYGVRRLRPDGLPGRNVLEELGLGGLADLLGV